MYGKHLSRALSEKVDDFLGKPITEQVSLYEELALTRIAAIEALKLADPVITGKLKVDERTRVLAISMLHEAMDRVKDMVMAVGSLEKSAEDKVSVRVVQVFVNQIVRAIYRVLGDDQEARDLGARLEKEIRENVALPKVDDTGYEGGSLTANDILREMSGATQPNPTAD